jgi:hypothetical protein
MKEKTQIPNSKLQINSNYQNSNDLNKRKKLSELEKLSFFFPKKYFLISFSNLVTGIYLGFGAWNLLKVASVVNFDNTK